MPRPNTENQASVLVVDDESLNIFVLEALLEDNNVSCESAMSGELALSNIKSRISGVEQGLCDMYKLILLDYCMEGMDGPEVAREIRRLLHETGI